MVQSREQRLVTRGDTSDTVWEGCTGDTGDTGDRRKMTERVIQPSSKQQDARKRELKKRLKRALTSSMPTSGKPATGRQTTSLRRRMTTVRDCRDPDAAETIAGMTKARTTACSPSCTGSSSAISCPPTLSSRSVFPPWQPCTSRPPGRACQLAELSTSPSFPPRRACHLAELGLANLGLADLATSATLPPRRA